MGDLTAADSHFAFGKNWRSFAGLIDDERIANSDRGVQRLFPDGALNGKTVIDIGCGSGLPALSLLRAGAAHVTCIDIDADSVATARDTLERHAPAAAWSAAVTSVFEASGRYDAVYSWGVLHHTGDMWRAIDKAGAMVAPGGILAIAIYAETPLCGVWKVEKAIYARASAPVQKLIRILFGVWRTVISGLATGFRKRPPTDGRRGMERDHDIHDWLGGYPYESATPEEIDAFLTAREFSALRVLPFGGRRHGLFGSACDEYVYRRA